MAAFHLPQCDFIGNAGGVGRRAFAPLEGERHEVFVEADGFVYGGKRHRSLSAIARSITGSRWNGPRFFDLREGEGDA